MNAMDARHWRKNLEVLSDELLLERTKRHALSEREQTAWLVAHLAEVYRRDLALQRGYSSAVHYARSELGLTDAMAWERVRAARLALELPEVVEQIASGKLTLASAGDLWRVFQDKKAEPKPSAASALQPGLEIPARLADSGAPVAALTSPKPVSQADKRELLHVVLGKTRQESEAVLREWKEEKTGAKEVSKPRPSSTRKVHSKEWTELELYLGAEELEKFDRLRDLLSHRLGTRDPHAVMSWLLELGLEKVDPLRQEARAQKRAQDWARRAAGSGAQKSAEACGQEAGAQMPSHNGAAGAAERRDFHNAPARKSFALRKPSPAALKRRIWARDQHSGCQYKDPQTGRICGSTAFLDIDHILEVRNGGQNTEENLRLLCRSHNRRRHIWE